MPGLEPSKSSLGVLDVIGYTAAVAAADAMAKSAEVDPPCFHFPGGGVVAITVRGEIAAIRVSVGAAIDQIADYYLIGATVLGRPSPEALAAFGLDRHERSAGRPNQPSHAGGFRG